jgi:predicted nucleic acid-binding protein
MTPSQVVVDTDIVINLLKKQPETVARFLALAAAKTAVLLSPIVVAEVYAGAFLREHSDIEAFFSLCRRIDIDHETARLAGRYANDFRKSHQSISLEDVFLAAAAKAQRCPLWTGNRKHYPMDDIELLA